MAPGILILYPAQQLRWAAAQQGPAVRGSDASGLCQKSLVTVVTICIAVAERQLCQLCISTFIRGKYDFTSQFI
jgi:hypothetical protein